MRDSRFQWSRPYTIVILALLMLFLAAGLSDSPPENPDACRNLVLEQAIRSGFGFRLINDPHIPRDTKTPPLIPFILAAFHSLFGFSFLGGKFVPLLFGYAALILLYLLLRPLYRHPGYPLLICALSVCWPYAYREFTRVMIDIPYLFFVILTAYLLQRQTRTASLLAILAGILAFLTRTNGVILLAVIACSFYRSEFPPRRRLLPAVIVLCGGVVIGYFGFQVARNGFQGLGYFYEISTKFGSLQDLLAGQKSRFQADYLLVFLASLLPILRHPRRRSLNGMEWFPVFHLLLLFCFPFVQSRYLIPAVPFALHAFFSTIPELPPKTGSGRRWRTIFQLILAVGLILFIVRDLRFAYGEHTWRGSVRGELSQAAEWIRENTSERARLVAWEDELVYLLSHRRTLWCGLFFAHDRRFRCQSPDCRYLVLSPQGRRKWMAAVETPLPGTILWQKGGVTVYQLP